MYYINTLFISILLINYCYINLQLRVKKNYTRTFEVDELYF